MKTILTTNGKWWFSECENVKNRYTKWWFLWDVQKHFHFKKWSFLNIPQNQNVQWRGCIFLSPLPDKNSTKYESLTVGKLKLGSQIESPLSVKRWKALKTNSLRNFLRMEHLASILSEAFRLGTFQSARYILSTSQDDSNFKEPVIL